VIFLTAVSFKKECTLLQSAHKTSCELVFVLLVTMKISSIIQIPHHRLTRESGISLVRILVYLSVPALVGFITFLTLRSIFEHPIDSSDTTTQSIEIPRDSTLATVAAELENRGFIKYSWPLRYAGRVSKKDSKIVAGEYEIRRSMSVVELLNAITSGKPIERKIVVREGVSIREIGQIVESAGLLKKAEFNQALTERSLIKSSGSDSGELEGYLFPETYIFSRPITAREVVVKMVKVGLEHWSQSFSDRAAQLGMTRHQIMTLASIIEKESGDRNEQPTISSVFHNRLKQQIPLQSDPTVIYGLGDQFDGNLTRSHLETPTLYNTYTITGLPPGPICNPGDSAINAALYPAETPYIFFVADGTGKHVFSTTLEEHNAAVAQYQIRQNSSADSNQPAVSQGDPNQAASNQPPANQPTKEPTNSLSPN
jgi:UPF0755 protein